MTRTRQRSTLPFGADIEKLLATFWGRWAMMPLVIAIVTIFTVGMITTLLQLDALPEIAYTAPAVPPVLGYYFIQGRRVWRLHVRTDINSTKGDVTIGRQNVAPNGLAPIIHGNNNTVTVLQSPPQERSPPEPARPSTPFSAEPAPTVPTIEIAFEGEVDVPGAGHEKVTLDLEAGDTLEGSILVDSALSAYVMTDNKYHRYWEDRMVDGAKTIMEDASSGRVKWRVPKTGRYHLVLDTYGKQDDRTARISLRRVRAPGPI